MRNRGRAVLLAGAASLVALPGLAHAQAVPADEEVLEEVADAELPPAEEDQIVVTGTLVRGIAPVGTAVVDVTAADVTASGARSSLEVLATVPQVTNFFNRVNVPTTNFGSPANRPLIRGLPTLVMLNGYRIVGTGIIQTSPEPNQIAPGSIQRVEVIPGSGASLYGSDAVGGVINFITRRGLDGVEASARYGVGDDFNTVDAQATAGMSWDSGSAFVSYAYAFHDRIKTFERPYLQQDLRPQGGTDFRTTACPNPNILVGGVTYGLPSRAPGANRCDRNLFADFYPEETRHNVLVGVDQQFNDSISFNATAYFSRRDTSIETPTASTSQTITSANPFFRPIGTETSHTVSFAYDPVFGPVGENNARFDSWGITPELTFQVFGDWRARLGGNYGRSDNFNSAYEINAGAQGAAINGTTFTTALNPYDLSQTSAGVLATIANSRTIGETEQNLYQLRAIADGTAFTLFGNDAQLAVGVEYLANDVTPSLRQGPTPGATFVETYGSRDVKSVFGELVVPILSESNEVAWINSLSVSGSARYDDYSDFGGTFNPKLATTYEPVKGVRFIANWGRNFHAPELTDTANTVDARNQFIPVSNFLPPNADPVNDGRRPTILIAGGNPNLQPETSRTWSVGVELEPDFIPGLRLGADYYNTRFRDRIFLVLPFPASNLTNPALQSFFNYNPTLAQAQALLAGRRNDGFTSVDSLYIDPNNTPFLILDARRANLGAVNLEGLDFRANYNNEVGPVSVNAGIDANYILTSETQQVPNTPFVNSLENGTARLTLSAYLGGSYEGFRARATFFESGSYPVQGIVGQTRVDDFETLNLFFSYDLEQFGFEQTQITLNIDNVTDSIPPFINQGTGGGRANGSTLGRVFTFGVSTGF